MKLKHIALIGSLFPILFSLVLFFGVLISADSDDENSNFSSGITGMNLSAEVLKHQPMVEKYAREYGISEYVNVLLAIIQVESGGTAEDVMQSSESLGLPPNSLDTESSIKQGCKYFASLLSSCKNQGIDDLNVAIQSYNYGGGYVGYVAGKGKKHTFNLAESFAREDGSQKWVDFSATYWHVDCVRKLSLNAFIDHYQKWCKRRKYNFSRSKAVEIYEASKELVSILPKDDLTKLIIKQAVEQLNTASQTVEQLRTMMNEAASKLPEYPVVMAMKGVGKSLGPQLMAEIGDVSRFTHKGAITAFAGVDPGVNESGSYEQKSVPASKRGSSTLRKTLFQVMDVLIKTKPQDDPVYLFMDKKRAQGKPYYVYMTAGANKFLRIYYGRVKEYLSSLPE